MTNTKLGVVAGRNSRLLKELVGKAELGRVGGGWVVTCQ